ncbi:MAG TPA: hypothetical protein DEF35_09005 [Paenibacillus sp.]|nr:hypothetical protein [Paenibacillus sp.]OZQ64371.1 hypothetical protein CA599_22675 [Paenibacillus taichungensis]HBU81763.1 hypothetical protein [Paenibacillus sp.]
MNYPYSKSYFAVLYDLMEFQFEDNNRRDILQAITDFHYNLLGFARVKVRLNRAVDLLLQQENEVYTSIAMEYEDTLSHVEGKSEEDELYIHYMMSGVRDNYLLNMDDLELEKALLHKGIVISVYSSLEDTVLKLTSIITEIMQVSVSIDDICKRDRGVFKYFKFLELGCGIDLSASKDRFFSDVYRWNRIRNQLVHVGDYIKTENTQLLKDLEDINISLKDRQKMNLSSENIDSLLELVDEFLESIINACWIKLKS